MICSLVCRVTQENGLHTNGVSILIGTTKLTYQQLRGVNNCGGAFHSGEATFQF